MKRFTEVADHVGQMNHRIEIISLTTSEDSDFGGDIVTGETTLATVWATWEPKETATGEKLLSDQKDDRMSVNFRIRYLSTVKSTMLVKYENLYYNILSVIPDSKRFYTILETEFLGDSWDKTT
jgi:SPP1 family predicted phage head-tail adaptor